jgi:hypothetical protein
MVVRRFDTYTLVIFPNGQEVLIDDSQAQIVEQVS